MTFSIYPDTLSPLAEWTETQDSVVVKEGIFNVLLGSVDSIPASVFSGSIKYLGVQVESDPEMTPLKPMVSVAYAYRAGAVDGGPGSGWVDDGTVVRLETDTDYVGIGTPTPGNKLHVASSESVPILNVEQTGSSRAVRVYSQNACALWVANAGNHGLRVSNAGGDGIHVEQAGNNGIRVKNAGGFAGYFEGSGYFRDSVGIGTASPGSKLEINGDGTLQFAINNTSGRNWVMRSDNTGKFSLWDFSGLNEAYVVSSSGAPGGFTFQFNGNVGVGTASPNYKLDVQGTVGIDIGSNFNDIPFTIDVPSNQAGLISRIAKGGSVINVVDKDGNVGIGTGSPTSNLHIREDKDGIVSVTIENRDTGNLSSERVTFWDENGGVAFIAATDDGYPTNPNRMVIANNRPGAAVTFETQSLTRLTVANDGNVGVGTASPNYKLDVQGTVGIDIGSNFNDIPLTINVPSNQAGLISRIAKGGSVINVVDKDGNVGIGTTSPQGALDVSSTTGAFIVPRMTTAQRDALTAVNGMIIYNLTANQFNFYENGAWVTK